MLFVSPFVGRCRVLNFNFNFINMLQLIIHGIGDYFLQTDYQALNKKKDGWIGLWACLKHCITYSLPFLFIGSWKAVLVIFITHFIIDRTNIVAWLIAYKNGIRTIENFGFGLERPFAITIWLYIICDNLLHIICNYVALRYF
jgi:Protein of unknown function (DUF3307)